jgi:hypothetical protein
MIFGVILPFIGFRAMDVDEEGNPVSTAGNSPYEADAFMLAWLGHIYVVGIQHPIRPKAS